MGNGKKKSSPEDHPTKICKTCGANKDRNEYASSKSGIGGIHGICKVCMSKATSDKYLAKHPRVERQSKPIKIVRPNIPNKDINGVIHKHCGDCDTFLPTTDFYKSNNPRNKQGVTSICKTCDGIRRKDNHLTVVGRFKQLISDAKRWKHGWAITFDEFKQFWQKPCIYCGCEIKTAGLDRVDANGIYELSNCVSCCHNCNQAKMDRTLFDFLNHVNNLHLNIDNVKNMVTWHCEPNTTDCFICGLKLADHQAPCKKMADRKVKSKKGVRVSPEYVAERARIYAQTPRGRYTTYKKKAIFKEIDWDLSEVDFFSMWQQDCVFCGANIKTIGVDRLNSDKGYNKLNINPVCVHCNQFKMNHSLTRFVELIEQIHSNLNLG